MFKRTFVSGLVAVSVAAGTLVSSSQPSAAHHHLTPAEAAGIAGIGGFILGTIVAQPHREIYVRRASSWDIHVNRCYARYHSYDEGSDSYLGYDGYRHYCSL